MQLPKRRSELLRRNQNETVFILTPEAHAGLKRKLVDLKKRQRPQAVEDLVRARELGDLSENADYKAARQRLSAIDGQIFHLSDRLKRVVLIEKNTNHDGRVGLGSTVTVEVDGRIKSYFIVGSHESDPAHGKISHVSPLGSALLGRAIGERVSIRTQDRDVVYEIKNVE